MARVRRQDFSELSPAERAAVGAPEDYEWDEAVELPARAKPESAQFSLRVERSVFEGLQELARRRGVTFSDAAREALERYVRNGGSAGLSNVQVSFARDKGMLVQVPGRRAELPGNRRSSSPDERVPVSAEPRPVTY